MAVRDILLLGNPLLYQPCALVEPEEFPALRAVADDLHDTLLHFRATHGVGRGIAAPQIGVPQRLVVLDLQGTRKDLVNPRLTARSQETFAIWDDCMSFPNLLVRVLRHRQCTVAYQDLGGAAHVWEVDDENIAELLQHELDHLDGVLAVSRAMDGQSFALRSETEGLPGRLIQQGA
ncbi:MAG: peptide deformylase [Bryobacterales bacterium]|jgi:peptide deformylase|nr:peptide deformylase [Bryobacterales bacterium]